MFVCMENKKYGTFYLLPSRIQHNNEFYFQKRLICNLIKIKWRSGKSVLIACEDEVQAKEIDEALWKFDLDSFLPHALFGQNSFHCSPIVICWEQFSYDHISKDILINLMNKQMNFFINFNRIIDFVSSQDILKNWARIRYKFYKNAGFQLRVIDA